MRKIVFMAMVLLTVMACSDGQQAPFNYRGLPLTLSAEQFIDSMQNRGFAVDSAASDSGRTVVLANPAEHYRVLMAFNEGTILAIQENYTLSSNDSTRQMWQQLRDGLEKELDAWPDCPILKDDHKVANFDTGDGFVAVILENTYTPTLSVRYKKKSDR